MKIDTKFNVGDKCFIQTNSGEIMEATIIEIHVQCFLFHTFLENKKPHIAYTIKGWMGEFVRYENMVFLTKDDLIASL